MIPTRGPKKGPARRPQGDEGRLAGLANVLDALKRVPLAGDPDAAFTVPRAVYMNIRAQPQIHSVQITVPPSDAWE